MKVLCGVLSGVGKCCSPVMCACVCAASTSSFQTVAVSGPFRPVCTSVPVAIGGTGVTEKSPPIFEGELCRASSPSVRLGWNTV